MRRGGLIRPPLRENYAPQGPTVGGPPTTATGSEKKKFICIFAERAVYYTHEHITRNLPIVACLGLAYNRRPGMRRNTRIMVIR